MNYLLGVDIGTSGTKAVLFDLAGNAVASASREYTMEQPHAGWAEQEPQAWIDAIFAVTREIVGKTGIDPKSVLGMGLSGQMHTLVFLDKENKPLRPAILWCDQRTEAEVVEMDERIGRDRLIAVTANAAMTGFSAAKVLWVRNHEPEVYEKTRKILLCKDYVRFCLTNEYATEVSDAGGMQLLDVPNRCWSKEVIHGLDIPMEWLPRVYESYEISGCLTREAAERSGLWEGMPVCGGAGDNAAGAVGTGVVRPGVAFCTLGTSGVVFAHSDTPQIDPGARIHTLCHAVPGAWHTMGVVQTAGLSLRWLRDTMCRAEVLEAAEKGVDPYDIMTEEAKKIPIGADGLIFLPYLMGERSPWMDAHARGVFFGMTPSHTRGHFVRSVMEGVTLGLADSVSIMREMGIPIEEVRAGGGGGRSPFWRQMQADVFNSSVVTANSPEAGALGVALLAGVGVGVYPSVPEACDTVISTANRIMPNEEAHREYINVQALYRSLYPALKPVFDASAGLYL